MHKLLIREEVYEKKRWIAESLFNACEEAKTWAIQQMRFSGAQRFMLPWLHDEIEEMLSLMGENAWAYGVQPNEVTLNTFMQFLIDQHFVKEALPLSEMFAPIISWSE